MTKVGKFISRTLLGALIGIGIGFLIALTFSALYEHQQFWPSSSIFVDHFATSLQAVEAAAVLWAAMGILFALTAFIFEIETWSSLRQTTVHFFVTYLGFTPLAILAGWFPTKPVWLTFYTIVFILIYAGNWLFFSWMAKRKIAEVNELLAKR